jgi:hypothetical protein
MQNIVFVTTIFGALMWLCPRQGDWKNIQGFKCKHLNTITFIFHHLHTFSLIHIFPKNMANA